MSLNLLPSEAKFQAQRMRIKKIANTSLWIIGGVWFFVANNFFWIEFLFELEVEAA